MKNIYVNRKIQNGPYGGGNLFLKALGEYCDSFGWRVIPPSPNLPKELINKNIDVIFMMDPRAGDGGISWIQAKEIKNTYNIPIVHRINEIDKKRENPIGIDVQLRSLSEISDISLFVSDWLKNEMLTMGWGEKTKNKVLYNGVIRKDNLDVEKSSKKDGKIRICVHHWSPDPGKGDELHRWLDEFVDKNDGYIFNYIGRTNLKFNSKNSNHISPLVGDELYRELMKQDVYINGSKNDPAPNSVLEALICNLPTYVPKFGGGSLDLIYQDESHIWKSYEELENLLIKKSFQKNEKKRIRTWEECIKEFFNIINESTG